MKNSLLASALLGLTLLCNASAQTTHLSPLSTFGPNADGSLRPGDRPYLTIGGTERGMAYNPVTGHILVVSRVDPLNVYILDGMTGADIGTLDLSVLVGGGNASFLMNMIGVADD